tara:strand:+ start:2337 stop:3884 length:1548 start_codon:yes stop_codon:yes gene_type:complete
MSKALQTLSVKAPGFLGLNTQDASLELDTGYCLKADNLIIDKAGRLASRKGWKYTTTAGTDVNLVDGLKYEDTDGTVRTVAWSNTTFYSGEVTLTPIVPTTSETISTGNWSAAVINDLNGTSVYFYQTGYTPLVLTYATGSLVFQQINSHTNASGTAPLGSIVATEFGRTWVAGIPNNKLVVKFSDLLNGHKWGTGSFGQINLASVIQDGTDEITGVASHAGYLIIFLRNHIAIYTDSDGFQLSIDLNSLKLVEVIQGVGCISQKTIQYANEDVMFLSNSGVRSLGRTIQEKSQPLTDISKNIRDDLISDLAQQTESEIIAVYSSEYDFYLLSFPTSKIVYCFDLKAALPNGSFRVTKWISQTHKSLFAYKKEILFFEQKGIAKYSGYLDNTADYGIEYRTNYLDFKDASKIKILKKISMTTIGGVGQELTIGVNFDYQSSGNFFNYTLSGSPVSQYNIAEFNVGTFSKGITTDNTKASLGGAGNILQLVVNSTVTGFALALQKVDLFVKQGKVL